MSRIKVTNLRHESATSDNISLDSNARVGIGTSSPVGELEVQAATTPEVMVRNTTTSSYSSLHLAEVGDSSGTFVVNRLGSTSTATGGARAGQIWNSANAPIVFATNGTEEMRLLAGGGLTFNGDTAAANALDDYEEGTWTPVFKGAGTAGSYTLNVREASYTKIGRMVHLYCDIIISTVNSAGSAYAVLEGMPFDVGSQSIGSCSLGGVDIATAGSHYHVTRVSAGTDHRLFFMLSRDNLMQDTIAVGEFGAGDSVYVTMMYTAA